MARVPILLKKSLPFIGPALLVALLIWLDPRTILARLAEADGAFVAAAILLNLPLIGLKVIRWVLLMRCNGIAFPWARAVLVYSSALFIGYLTPGRAGELLKVVPVSRYCRIPVSKVLPSVLGDRLFDVYVLLSFALLGLGLLWDPNSITLFLAALGLFFCFSFGLFLLLNLRFVEFIARRLQSLGRLGHRAGSGLLNIQGGLRDLRRGAILTCLALTIAAYVIFFGQCALAARSLGLNLPLEQIVVAVASANVAGFLPISISNIGTRDAVIVGYLTTQGISASWALSFSLLIFIVFNVTGAVLGGIAWMWAGRQRSESLVDQVGEQANPEQNGARGQQQ